MSALDTDLLKKMASSRQAPQMSSAPVLPKFVELLMQYQRIMDSLFNMEQLQNDQIVASTRSIVTIDKPSSDRVKGQGAFNLASPAEILGILRGQVTEVCAQLLALVDEPESQKHIVDKDTLKAALQSMTASADSEESR